MLARRRGDAKGHDVGGLCYHGLSWCCGESDLHIQARICEVSASEAVEERATMHFSRYYQMLVR